jgi:hypothetical protein
MKPLCSSFNVMVDRPYSGVIASPAAMLAMISRDFVTSPTVNSKSRSANTSHRLPYALALCRAHRA